jgi:NADPH-dependent glutamate synthase beta subunit-like oxidoreductase
LARDGYQATVFEARPEPGGVLRYGVVPYRFDLDFLEHELEDVMDLGVQFQCDTPIRGRGGAEKLLQDGYNAVFLAPGLWEAMSLQPDAEPAAGRLSSVAYLASLRDGRLEDAAGGIAGRSVAVIGGGSVAIDCTESAVKLGARDVYLIYRRSYRQMPADAEERVAAQEGGVHFLLLNQPVGYLTDGQGRIRGVKLVRTRLGEPDVSGRRRPESIAGSEWVLEVDLVIEAIGNRAPDDAREWYPHVELQENGLIKADPETGMTSVPGIFAGGDIVRGPGLVVQAVQDGKTAARAIKAFLNGQEETA